MLSEILPEWVLLTITVAIILFSLVAEWLIQRNEKKQLKECSSKLDDNLTVQVDK